jgi:hypothetical protein
MGCVLLFFHANDIFFPFFLFCFYYMQDAADHALTRLSSDTQYEMIVVLVLVLLFSESVFCVETTLSTWRMQRVDLVPASARSTSVASFDASAWFSVQVPCTVMGGLIQNGFYPDVYRGLALSKVPTAQFDKQWLFRATFEASSGRALLTFKGVSYRALVYVNGQQIGEEVEGTFAYHDVVIDAVAGTNAVTLAVTRDQDEVFPPDNDSVDLGITFIDWSPLPPDHNMGLIRPVTFTQDESGFVVRYPVLNTSVSSDLSLAAVLPAVEVFNYGSALLAVPPLSLTLHDTSSTNESPGNVPPGQVLQVLFPAVSISSPTLWWPWQLGEPNLRTLTVSSSSSSVLVARVGLRQVSSGLDEDGYRFYSVNGRRVQMRGAGWANELLLQNQHNWTTHGMRLAKNMGLNMIRLEGVQNCSLFCLVTLLFVVSGQLLGDEIFSTADELGMWVFQLLLCYYCFVLFCLSLSGGCARAELLRRVAALAALERAHAARRGSVRRRAD